MDKLEILNLLGLSMIIASLLVFIGLISYDIWNESNEDTLAKWAKDFL